MLTAECSLMHQNALPHRSNAPIEPAKIRASGADEIALFLADPFKVYCVCWIFLASLCLYTFGDHTFWSTKFSIAFQIRLQSTSIDFSRLQAYFNQLLLLT